MGFCVISTTIQYRYLLCVLLKMNETANYLDAVAEGSTSAYPFLRPSDIANDHWNKTKTNQTQIRTLTRPRDTLLPKLMSGEVRVKM